MPDFIFLFPGQGSHEVGMGADLFQGDAWFRDLVASASETLDENLERLCLRGPEKRLMQSAFVQPLLVAISLAYWRRLGDAITPRAIAGHSLGELTALAASGALSPEQAVFLALERGRLMDEAAAATPGGMAAVFLSISTVEELIEKFGMTNLVHIANDNAPEQVVVSAAQAELEEFIRRINDVQPGACQRLRVCGPWHTPLLREAAERFRSCLAGVSFTEPRATVLLNTTAAPPKNTECLREAAAMQLTGRVRWRETMQALKTLNSPAIIEIGPRRVLAGLARLNGFGVETPVASIASINSAMAMVNSI